jgi:hypothetical protein
MNTDATSGCILIDYADMELPSIRRQSRDDLAALKAAAQLTADIARNRNTEQPVLLILAFRVNERQAKR